METKRFDLKTVQPSIDCVIEFLEESVPTGKLPQVDAIFVFGHYEPKVAHHAAKLYQKGKAPYIIISGKGRDAIPEGFGTEADFYASLVESDGVPKQALILEKQSTNSLENVLLGIAACQEMGIHPKSLILCAMPPLLRRSCATFRKQFPEITVYGSAFPMPKEWFTARRIDRLLGELERLDDYVKKGDIVKVEIPHEVRSSAETIRLYFHQSEE